MGIEQFIKSIGNNNLHKVKQVIQNSKYMIEESFEGHTPLWFAVKYKNIEIVKTLLYAGANVNAKSKPWGDYPGGSTALMVASYIGNMETIIVLLNAGADVNATEISGTTALRYAYLSDNRDVMELLKNHGAIDPQVDALLNVGVYIK
ncbi:MAG: ankyrin repeat domain-containing protein [Bacteroidetes bacterium]|nr:ankyrin repeat domain-containing protein [Bacteroidota bacterium]